MSWTPWSTRSSGFAELWSLQGGAGVQVPGSPVAGVLGSHLSCSHLHMGWDKEAQNLAQRQVAAGFNENRPFVHPSTRARGSCPCVAVLGEISGAGFPSPVGLEQRAEDNQLS